jgi:DNA-binding beta-propeller fold protein YncE
VSETPAPRIFLSYRRDDSQGFAGRIYDRMAAHFGPGAVFRDINDIEPGRPWEEAIDEAIDYCDVFVLLIGGEWLDATDDQGSRRLEDPEDRHRREIETAVGREIRIFVALMEDAEMPSRRQLPAESSGLSEVPALHALRIADYAFDYGMEQLIGSIERAVRQARESVVERGPPAVPAGEAPPTAEAAPTREPEVPVGRPPVVEEPARRPRERAGRGRRPLVLAALALGAVAVIVIVALVALSGGGGDEGPAVATVSVGDGQPVGVGLASGQVWVTDRTGRTVSLIKTTGDTQTLDGDFEVGESPEAVAVDPDGTVWVTNHGSESVSRLVSDDFADHQVTVGESPGGIAVDPTDGSIWVAIGGENAVLHLASDGTPLPPPVNVREEPYGVAVANDGTVWVTNRVSDSVSQILPGKSTAEPEIRVGHNPKGIDATSNAVWVANADDTTVSRIDPANTGARPKEFEVGDEPRGVVAEFGSVWVTLGEESAVARLDPGSGDVEKIDVGEGPEGIAAGPSSIWVANGDSGTVSRITP